METKSVLNRLNDYVKLVEELNKDYYDRMGFTQEVVGSYATSFSLGKKFAKVYVGTRIHTFVDLINGNILKAATYNAPAKNGVRGNIFTEDCGRSIINEFGAKYLK